MLGLKSITAKLAIGLLIIVSGVSLGFGYQDYIETKEQLQDELIRDVDIVKTRMETSIPASLWNYETDILNRILFSEIKEIFIAGIQVVNDSGEVAAGVVTEKGEGVASETMPTDHSYIESSELTFVEDGEENPVGSLNLYISDEYIQKILQQNLESIVQQVLITDLLILILFYFALRPIVGPLKYLTEVAGKIAEGDYSEEVQRRSQDEVGNLSESFNTMRLTIKKKMYDLASINSVGEQLTLTYDRNKALGIVLNSMGEHSHFKRGSIFLKNPETGDFQLRGYYPEAEEMPTPRTFSVGEGIIGLAVQKSESIFIPDTAQDERFVGDSGEGKALLCVPLIDGTETIGAINFSGEIGKVVYEEGDKEYMGSIARSLVITLKNIGMREEIEEHNRNLEIKVQERTAALQSKTNDISAMMRNLRQGLFTIMEDLTIHHEYSKFLEEILGTEDIANQAFMGLLFEGSDLNADQKDQVHASVSSLIGSDEMMWDFNSHILPSEIVKTEGEQKKVFELDWNPILMDDEIEKIMVTVRDVTELRKLQLEALEQKRELEIISQIISLDAGKFFDFIDSASDFVAKNRELINAAEAYSDDLMQILFRNMHTIKGNARTYGFTELTECVHLAETTYDDLRKADEPQWSKDSLLEELQDVEEAIKHYASVANDKLGLNAEQQSAGLNTEVIEDLITTLNRFNENELFKDYHEDIHDSLKSLYSTIEQSLEDTVSEVANSLPSLAKAVDKPAPEVKLDCDEIFFDKPTRNMLNDVLMHCLRNSIDHGIESPDERKGKGKNEQGTIEVSSEIEADYLTLSIGDDGRGLALSKIKEKALSQGLLNEGEDKPAQEIAQFVFHSGLSTAEKVSQISGRGVGMDAVRNFLRDKGGDIALDLEGDTQADFVHFKTRIKLPNSLYHRI